MKVLFFVRLHSNNFHCRFPVSRLEWDPPCVFWRVFSFKADPRILRCCFCKVWLLMSWHGTPKFAESRLMRKDMERWCRSMNRPKAKNSTLKRAFMLMLLSCLVSFDFNSHFLVRLSIKRLCLVSTCPTKAPVLAILSTLSHCTMGLAFVVPAFPSRTNLRMKAPSKLVNEHYISHWKKLRLHGSVIMNFSESWLVSDTQLQPHWKYEETKQHSWLPAIVVSVMLKCWCFLQVLSGFAQQWNAVNWYISQMPNRKFCGICFLISHNLNWGRWTTWQKKIPFEWVQSFQGCESSGFRNCT